MFTKSKKKLLVNCRLYLILDKRSSPQNNAAGLFRRLNKTGIDMVQLREKAVCDSDFLKDAEVIKRLCQNRGIIFLINNRLDIAQIINADGLHLGQSDLPLTSARKILGKNKIIGVSCRNLTHALKAQDQGANYISVGPIFATPLKPGLTPVSSKVIKSINKQIKIPVFAVGGINRSNIKKIVSFNMDRIALCRAICRAGNIKKTIRELKNLIDSGKNKNDPDPVS